MKKNLMVLSGFVLGLAPVVAFAQIATGGANSICVGDLTNTGTLFTLMCKIGTLLNSVIPVFIALAVAYFVWGVISYVMSGDEEAKKAGRDRIIFGLIGLAVIIGMWGLVNLLRNTFGLNNTQNITLPTVPVIL